MELDKKKRLLKFTTDAFFIQFLQIVYSLFRN